jgi:flavorubredoxin
MVKVNFFYDTKYGNTNLAAEKIAEGLREIEGIDVDMS